MIIWDSNLKRISFLLLLSVINKRYVDRWNNGIFSQRHSLQKEKKNLLQHGEFWFTTNKNVKVLRYWYTVPCNYKEIPNLHSTAFWIILLISTRAKLMMSLHPSMYLVFNYKLYTFWRVTLIVLLYNIRFFQLILLHRSETSCVHHHLQEVFGGWHNVPHHPLHQVRRWWIHGRRWTHSKKNNLRIPGYLTIRGAFSSRDYTKVLLTLTNGCG